MEENIIGMQFDRLTVIEKSDIRTNNRSILYKCTCSCKEENPNIVYRTASQLRNKKHFHSCGCYMRKHNSESLRKRRKKYNKYDLSGEYGIGWTTNTNKEFWFDLEDYDKIKDCAWYESRGKSEKSNGYICSQTPTKKHILLHKFIMNVDDNSQVDHISHNKWDCRKSQLRIVTNQQNSYNKKSSGVNYDKERNKFTGHIKHNGKKYQKRFSTYEEARVYRLNLEKIIQKEFQYNKEEKETELKDLTSKLTSEQLNNINIEIEKFKAKIKAIEDE